MHWPLEVQHRMIRAKLIGHYNYYGVVGNAQSLGKLRWHVNRVWRRCLSRRSRDGYMSIERFEKVLARFPIPLERIRHAGPGREAFA